MANTHSNQFFNVKNLVTLALLSALLVIMAFTPLGYLNIGALAITFNAIPVAIGAIALGWKGGAVLGAVFGLTSFSQCFGSSPLGTLLFSISPTMTFAQCVLPRVLMGICVGLIFSALSKTKLKKEFSFAVSGFFAAFLNTVFYMSSLMILFSDSDFIQDKWQSIAPGKNVVLFVAAFVGTNAIVEAVSATVITLGVAAALYHARLIKSVTSAA
jgi:uncharacterized membrane protein